MSRPELELICAGAGIVLAEDTAAGMGLVPQFALGARRTVTVWIGEPGEGLAERMASVLLGLEDTWLVIPRFSDSSGLGFAE